MDRVERREWNLLGALIWYAVYALIPLLLFNGLVNNTSSWWLTLVRFMPIVTIKLFSLSWIAFFFFVESIRSL